MHKKIFIIISIFSVFLAADLASAQAVTSHRAVADAPGINTDVPGEDAARGTARRGRENCLALGTSSTICFAAAPVAARPAGPLWSALYENYRQRILSTLPGRVRQSIIEATRTVPGRRAEGASGLMRPAGSPVRHAAPPGSTMPFLAQLSPSAGIPR